MRAVLFFITVGAGAGLMFGAQPMIARMVLPYLGGTPAVWNTCMVFFQMVVLAGYALAHGLAHYAGPRRQLALYVLLLGMGISILPVTLAGADETASPRVPMVWLLTRLATGVGLPAVALAVASPLLQRWYVRDRDPTTEPYVLYSASNIGSFGVLLGYPIALEGLWTLGEQARIWALGYEAWAVLVVGCGIMMLRNKRPMGADSNPEPRIHGGGWAPATVGSLPAMEMSADSLSPRRFKGLGGRWMVWAGLAAVPTSLLQSCTLTLTTDIASAPLLWVMPLGLYLLSFVVVFSGRGAPMVRRADRALPFLAVSLLFAILARETQPVLLLMGLHLAFLFAAGLVCHGRLMELRPASSDLTWFYLALASGGAAGGAFNALAAPFLFSSVAEYPWGIVLACAALAPRHVDTGQRRLRMPGLHDFAWAAGVSAVTLMLGTLMTWLGGDTVRLRNAIVFGVPAVMCCTQLDRPVRLALALGAAFIAGFCIQARWTGVEHAERNFFGITRVSHDGRLQVHELTHGNTIHGRQFIDADRRAEPLTYYHRAGPLGRIFDAFQLRPLPRRVGVIGLGVGSMAAYALPGEEWTFFEIDPAVIRVAQDTNWFTFLSDSKASQTRVVEGDGRLGLQGEADGSYDMLVLDAFSSDAIPVHLLTCEAVALYRKTLRAGGWLVIHISNRYLDLEPVVAALAHDAGWSCRSANDMSEGDFPGKEPSHWMLLAAQESDLAGLKRATLWLPVADGKPGKLWSDQRSSVFEALDWK